MYYTRTRLSFLKKKLIKLLQLEAYYFQTRIVTLNMLPFFQCMSIFKYRNELYKQKK